MSKKIIRGIMNAMTCLTPSPKKRKREENDSRDEKMNLPRNDTLIADVEEKLCSAEKVRLDMLESFFNTTYIFYLLYKFIL